MDHAPSRPSYIQSPNVLHASPLADSNGKERLRSRIEDLGRGELDAEDQARIRLIFEDAELVDEALRDHLSTALMDGFRKSSGRAVFGLLYELNAGHLIVQVAGRLRRYGSKADPGDVLQEVFFNVFRYPHRFDASRPDAFRVWTAMIVRNTVLKHMRSRSTGGNRMEIALEDLSDQPVDGAHTPLTGALDTEASEECSRAFIVYLQLYMQFYTMLSERERRALHLVEVDGVSCRGAAEDLEIKLENL